MARPEQVDWGWMRGRLFRMTREHTNGDGETFRSGEVLKCVMVSRMGDVGLTRDLKADIGYELRLPPWRCEPVDPIPVDVCNLCLWKMGPEGHPECRPGRKCERCGGETGPGEPVCVACYVRELREERQL